MSHRTSSALVLTVALLSAGCGTLDNVNRPAVAPPNNPDAKVCRIYGGVRSDFSTMLDYPWSHTVSFVDYVTVPVLAVLALGFDVVFDTITLPYTAYEEIYRVVKRPESSTNYVPGVAPPQAPGTPPAPGAAPLPPPRPVTGSDTGGR
jgi:uncharacterized protein YceK